MADRTTIPERLAVRLAAVAAASPLAGRGGDGVLEHRRTGLRARNVVGVIVCEDATLEILPKIDGAGDRGGVRRRLVHMLAAALNLRVEPGEIASLDEQEETLLEFLIRLFSTRLADALRRGMPRRYVLQEEDLPTVRGRLDATRQFTILAASPQRLACRFDMLSPDVAINRIMKAAVTRLRRIARAVDNQRRLSELAFAYADIADVSKDALRWDKVTIERTDERWRVLVELAQLLLDIRYAPSTA